MPYGALQLSSLLIKQGMAVIGELQHCGIDGLRMSTY